MFGDRDKYDRYGLCTKTLLVRKNDYIMIEFEGNYTDFYAFLTPTATKPEKDSKTIYQKLEEMENTIKEIKDQLRTLV